MRAIAVLLLLSGQALAIDIGVATCQQNPETKKECHHRQGKERCWSTIQMCQIDRLCCAANKTSCTDPATDACGKKAQAAE